MDACDRWGRDLGQTVTKEELGDEWPFSVDQGVVRCLPIGLGAVVFEAGGRTYALNGIHIIADIAGGTGALLSAILRKHPDSRGILFDQPHVVAAAKTILEREDVADRVRIESGSFFERVLLGADAYIMRRILHDWLDAEALAILRCCRPAMRPDARLLLIESVVGPPNVDPQSKFLDLLMLVSAGGRERTESEWRALLAEGGFDLRQVHPAGPMSAVIEAWPA